MSNNNSHYISPVHMLRQLGNKVRVIHYRISRKKSMRRRLLIPSYNATNDEFYPKGGLTVVSIMTPQGIEAEGHAHCDNVDPYNRKVGVKLAVERALEVIAKAKPQGETLVGDINQVTTGNLPAPATNIA
jgi:hypothetical protein